MEQMNPGQVKKYLKQLRQRQEQYLYYLGQLAYKAGEQGKLEDPELLEAYRTLKDIQGQVAQLETSLEQMKAEREAAQKPKCPYCGSALPKGAAFCAGCGTSLAAQPMASPPAVMPPLTAPAPAPAPSVVQPAVPSCPNCKSPLDEDAVFCGSCGTRIGGEAAQPVAPVPPPSPPPATPPVVAPGDKPSEVDIPSLDETVACPSCGYNITEPDMRFCPDCGAKIKE
jgi:membrane protease subunit (stomatin/prohibitin family)